MLTIRHYPDPVLRVAAKPVDVVDDAIRRLADEMVETMRLVNGVGLAAPQVGHSLRLIVVEFPASDSTGVSETRGFVNPRLTNLAKEKRAAREGCLSFPGLHAEVRRSIRATLQATDLDGAPITLELDGLLARVFQHEIDHLDAALYIDRMGPAALFSVADGLALLEERARSDVEPM